LTFYIVTMDKILDSGADPAHNVNPGILKGFYHCRITGMLLIIQEVVDEFFYEIF